MLTEKTRKRAVKSARRWQEEITRAKRVERSQSASVDAIYNLLLIMIDRQNAEVERLRAALGEILADPCVTDQMAETARRTLSSA